MLIPPQFCIDIHLHGSPVRLWRQNPPVASGGDATWQELNLPPEARALVGAAKRRIEHPTLGWITVSETTLTAMPDEIPVAHLDRVLLTTWEVQLRETIALGADVLTMGAGYGADIPSLVSRVMEISQGATVYAPTVDYTVDLATGTVVWVGGRGPMTATNYTVEYYYRPLYRFYLGDQDLPRPSGFGSIPGLANAAMPVTGKLEWEHPGD
jgi:hypothetical protein